MLWLIAIEKDGVWWNIYIDPTVTDIHANMYASKSLINYDNIIWEYDGDTPDSLAVNQLYIYGSIFSENTIWWADAGTYECPFFINIVCTLALAKKYDLNYLRRYILVSETDGDGNLTGKSIPRNGGLESYMGDNDRTNTEVHSPWYRVYPTIIEYNPQVQQAPPPFFN